MDDFTRVTEHAFCYTYERLIPAGETRILKMRRPSPNKRGVNDIGFACDDGITLYATLSEKPESANAIWQEIQPFDEINKTTSYIKIKNSGSTAARVNVRVIMN